MPRVPDATTLLRWANLIQPATLQHLLDHVVDLARQNRVTRGRKLRLDSTVVATTIHYPVDSTLLADGARVLTRTIQRAKPILQRTIAGARTLCRNRMRTVRRVTKQLIDATRHRGEAATDQVREGYQQLVHVTQQVIEQAQQVQQQLQTQLQQQRDRAAQRLLDTLETFVPRVEQVISQTTRRVLQGETVPASEKVVSLFEPHTAIIRKGKAGKPTEFGRVLWVAETEGGIITQARVLDGNPDDAAELVPSLDHHIDQFERPPRLLAGEASWRRRPMNGRRSSAACGTWCCYVPERRPRHGWPTSGNGGSGGGATGGRASRGGSVGSNEGKDWTGAGIMGTRGWSAG